MPDYEVGDTREIHTPDGPAVNERQLPGAVPVEENQPDPMLQMSSGRLGAGGLSLVALVVVAILAVVFYGLNGRNTTGSTQPAPVATANSGAPHG